jgi:hypothetical protein
MTQAAVPDVGLLIDDLAGAYQRSFGASRIGARERLNAAHLVDTLNRLDAEPDRVRGALRAALAKTKAEADLFDRIYQDAGRRDEASPELEPSPLPEPPAPEPEPAPGKSRKRLFLWLVIGAAVVTAMTFAVVLLSSKPDAPTPGPSPDGETNTTPIAPITDTPRDTAADTGANSARASGTATDNTASSAYADEISTILDRASEFGYRPSPRELASVLASSFDSSEADLTRDIARNAGDAPDQPIDLFDTRKLASVHAALHGPVAADIRDAALPAAIVERAQQQTEYLTFEDGSLVTHWRAGDAWREQAMEGPGLDIPALEIEMSQRYSPNADVQEVIVSADGSHALTRGRQVSTLWDLVALKQVARVTTPQPPDSARGLVPVTEAAFIAGTDDAVLYGSNGTVYLGRDSSAASHRARLPNISWLAGSPTGSGYLTLDGEGLLQVWSSPSHTLVASFTPPGGFGRKALSDNLEMVIGAVGATAEIWSTSGERLVTLDLPGEYDDAQFVANDTRVLVNHQSGASLYDVETAEVVSRFEDVLGTGAQSAEARRSADGNWVLIQWIDSADDNMFAAANASDGKLLSGAPTGSVLTTFGTPGDALKLIAVTAPVNAELQASDTEQSLIYVALTADGMETDDVALTLPSTATPYLNIPSIAEATARAAAFAEERKPKPLPDWPMWLAVATPLLIAAVVLAHPASWRRAYLSRRRIESDTLIRRLTANVTTFEPLAGERRAVGRLDQRLRQPSHRLDLRETVLATARAGGMFTPVADTDAGTPEYVALIERRRLTDADAARMVAFFNRLRAAGLSLTLYTYSGTPEALTPLRGGHAIPIETLRQRHAGAFLLITGDSARFHNRKTGGAATWTSRIGPVRRPGQGRSFAPTWSGGAFLSREPMPRLGPAERAIERDLGLIVRHTDASDLTAIGEYFHGRSASLAPHDEEGRRPVPAYFASSPERLVEEEPPGVIERQDLAPQLEAWLGAEGLRWVRALAYYPIVQWDLALYLASILMPHINAETRADMEAKVARLPWLEHGFMPEWVRQTLVDGADPKEEKRIVREIVAVMAEAREGIDGNISFQLMDPASGGSGDHSGDAIFIDAVARAKARPWDLPPPSQWLRRAPQALQMPWARMRIALAAIVLAIAAAVFTPHSGNMAPLAQWTPVLLFGLLALAMAAGPMLLTRYADRGRG